MKSMPKKIKAIIKAQRKAAKYSNLSINEFHNFFLTIGLFHNIFLYIEWEEIMPLIPLA